MAAHTVLPNVQLAKEALKTTGKKLKPAQRAFAAAYLENGGNASKAYAQIRPEVKPSTAYANGPRALGNAETRKAIEDAMNAAGVTHERVSLAVNNLLTSHDNYTALHYGIGHARAILGLDAPTEHHSIIDKRSVNLNIEVSRDSLRSMIEETK